MQITKVELIHKKEIKPGEKDEAGLDIAPQPEMYAFKVRTTDSGDDEIIVPNDPLNRDYVEVAEWYKKKKIKPFRFKFE